MPHSTGSTRWCTKVVVSGLLAGGALTLGGGPAMAGDHSDPLAPFTIGDTSQPVAWAVPTGACSLTVDAVGGQGGDTDGGAVGGHGGRVVSTFAVTAADELEILVGSQGSLSLGPGVVRAHAAARRTDVGSRWLRSSGIVHPDDPPTNGGVSGGQTTGGSGGLGLIPSAGGGGATLVFLSSQPGPPVVLAAGGGGAAGSDPGHVTGGDGGAAGVTGAAGSDGTGSIDAEGHQRNPVAPAWDGKGGGGGSANTGGAAGVAGTNGTVGTASAGVVGGAGGGDTYADTSGGGGGGGAGVLGGGGGGGAWRQDGIPLEAAGGGGGGGANLAPAGATVDGVSSTTGDGYLTVTPHACTPSAALDVSATAGDGTAHVTWTAPTDTGGAPITGYLITVYVNGVAIRTVTSPGPGLSATVPGLTNGTHYTFTVAAVNSGGAGAVAGESNVVTPVGPPAPPTPPAAPFVLQSQTLWGHVEIAAHSTRFAFEVTFTQARPSLRVTLTSNRTGRMLATTTIHPAQPGRRFTGVIGFPTSRIKNWGGYTWTLTTGAPVRQFTFKADVRQHSTLALSATRAQGSVTVTGSAKVLDARSNTYLGWAHRRVEIQRRTSTGWVTITTTTTDRFGHLRTVVHVGARTTLRLLDADTATQFGRASNARTV